MERSKLISGSTLEKGSYKETAIAQWDSAEQRYQWQ